MKDKSPEGWKKKKKEYVNIIKSVRLEQKWNLGGKKMPFRPQGWRKLHE